MRTTSRFEVFAKFCVATFGSSSSSSSSSSSAEGCRGNSGGDARVGSDDSKGDGKPGVLRVLDVAGGGGKLSAALIRLGCSSTIVDPRTVVAAGAARGAAGVAHTADGPGRIEAMFDSKVHETVARSSDVLLGLHCDGAVDEIVAAACALQKSFAIVACCVFSTRFKRTLADGTATSTSFWTNFRAFLSSAPTRTRYVLCSTWCPC